jgi:ArsR family metal-binding transcriptional regulator
MNQEVMYREGFSFFLVNIECLPNSDHFNIVMSLDESIEEFLAHLAACLPGCTYIHGTGVINLMDAGHIVAIHPSRITITDVRSMEEAEILCRRYMEHIREVSANHASISPVYHKKPSLTVLDIFRSLPRTNCGLCGSPTCMAFAAKVFRREDVIGSCGPIVNEKDGHEELFHKLLTSGYESP